MMKCNNVTIFLHSLMLLEILNILMLVNSNPVRSKPSKCTKMFISKNDSLYSHSEVFSNNEAPKTVEIFKYHCNIELALSTVNNLNINKVCSGSRSRDSDLLKLGNLTKTCKRYVEIKAYQYMLHKFLDTSNISNAAILSVMYLLQTAGESLQTIQYHNNKCYCPDFVGQQEEVYNIRVANNHNNTEHILNRFRCTSHWDKYNSYEDDFNVTWENPCYEKCQLYTSLYRSVIKTITAFQ